MYKVIFWDFDGVLINSNQIRDFGFKKVLEEYPCEQVEALLEFHKTNGGLSRYVKFNYFFKNIRGEHVSNVTINKLSNQFSIIMKNALINKDLLIKETLTYIKTHYLSLSMHIVSGSDEKELKFICKSLSIDKYFISINGSPTPKNELISKILQAFSYNTVDCVLIGDSINDYEASRFNKISFIAYNNPKLDKYSDSKIFI